MFEAAAFWPEPDDALHAGTARDDVAEAERAGGRPARAARRILHRLDLERVGDCRAQPVGRGRLDDEIEGAGAHRRDHCLDAALRGLHDHRHRDAALTHRVENAEAVDAWHGEIEDNRCNVATARAVKRLQRRFAAVGNDRLMAEFRDCALEQPALHGIVVDNEYRGSHV